MIDSDNISDGKVVIAQMHDDDKSTSMLLINSHIEQKVERSKVSVKQTVGQLYGSVFQVNKRKLEIADDEDDFIDSVFGDPFSEENSGYFGGVIGDNRSYVDTNTAQKLNDDDIVQLKEAGASGVDIIKSLIENSDTWNSKTEFAQEKWLKRKLKKYVCRMRLIKSSPASLCEVYHNKSRDKICGMRWDTLSQIISQSGLHAGRRVMIVDSCIGLLVGSAAYRMRGSGKILAVYGGQQPHFELVAALNLSAASTDIIQPISANELAPAADYVRKYGFIDLDIPTNQRESSDSSSQARSCESAENADAYKSALLPRNLHLHQSQPRPYNASGRNARDKMRVRTLLRQGAESLIIASKYNPLPILSECVHLLAPCSPIVIYHEFLEPLLPCYHFLLSKEIAVRIALADTWLREFQVLPGRCHPHMHSSGSGGYLLYATFVGNGESGVGCWFGLRPGEDQQSESH